MPSPQEVALWQAVTEKKYDKVQTLIKDHPELVNAENDKGRTLLIRVVLALVPPLDLIRFIAQHPDLRFETQSPHATQTTMGAILSTGRPDILEIFAKDPRIIFDGDKLAYVTSKKYVESATEGKKENYTKMFNIIRDTTIRHAMKTDNDALLEQLATAGDNLSQALSDGTLPVRLITKESPAPKAKLWFQSQIGKNGASAAKYAGSFLGNMQDMQQTKGKMDEATQDKLQAEKSLFDKAYDGTLAIMGRVGSSMGFSS